MRALGLGMLVALVGCRAGPPPGPPPEMPAPAKVEAAPPPVAAAAPDAGVPAPPPLTAQEAEQARLLITNNCLSCHAEQMLDQQRLTAKQWEAVTKKMQGWGTPIEPENVPLLIRYASERYGRKNPVFQPPEIDAQAAAAALMPLPDGAFAKGKAAQGKALYDAQCAKCHGDTARGAEMGTNLVDRPLLYRAPDFAAVVRNGRGRMPRFESSEAEIAAMLAYLRAQR